jgi:hypothetical protein
MYLEFPLAESMPIFLLVLLAESKLFKKPLGCY